MLVLAAMLAQSAAAQHIYQEGRSRDIWRRQNSSLRTYLSLDTERKRAKFAFSMTDLEGALQCQRFDSNL